MPRPSLPPLRKVAGVAAFTSLSRRLRTLLVAGVLFLVLFILALTMPVPYVVLSPGPTLNTLGADGNGDQIIMIDGTTPAKTHGHLNLTTVSVSTASITAFQAVSGWLAHDDVVVPTASVYPPGESVQQTNRNNTEDFISSQDNATAAALCELGYRKGFGVLSVSPDGPSHGVLRPGDFFVSVAGEPARSQKALSTVLGAQQPGTTVRIVLTRQGKTVDRRLTLGPPPQAKTGAGLGVTVTNSCLAPFTIDLGLANEIGGPSAGLMFALGIMDKLGGRDLTHGRFIAGTGTIDASGTVGPIGGIPLKMIAAKDKGASVFLAPAGNCAEVRNTAPAGLQIVKVDTLQTAVHELAQLENGKSVPGC